MKVTVKILRNTAKSYDSFSQASVLPLTREGNTGRSVPVLGMNVLLVQLHTLILHLMSFREKWRLVCFWRCPFRASRKKTT